MLGAVSLAVLATVETPRADRAAAVGLGCAVLALIRPEGFLVAAAVAAAVAVATRRDLAQSTRTLGAMLGTMAVPVGVYSAYLWSVSGQLLTGKWANLAGAHEAERLERFVRNLVQLESTLAAELSLVALVLPGGRRGTRGSRRSSP